MTLVTVQGLGIDLEKMERQLLLHEGLRLWPYRCTANKLTVGVGYNIDDRGLEELARLIGRPVTFPLTEEECRRQLRGDIQSYGAAVIKHFPGYRDLDPVRRRVAIDMAFNMGYRALKFRGTIAAVIRRDWPMVKRHMMDSLWADQVGDGIGGKMDRAERLAIMMETGRDPF